MEKLLSTESLMVLIVLLLPGFVYGRVKRWVVQDREAEKTGVAEEIYANLVRSLVMLTIWSFGFGLPAVRHLIQAVDADQIEQVFSTGPSLLAYALMVFIGPAALGVLMGFAEVKDMTNAVRSRLGLSPIEWSQAWDVAMAKASQEHGLILVLITLKNGETIIGRYGKESAASRSGGYRDLYLQELWDRRNGELAPAPGESILVRGSDIGSVRFIKQ